MIYYLFVDVETTGLDPTLKRSALLEVSAILTDRDFKEITRYHAVVEHTDWDIRNDYVLNMHLHNGLVADCLTRGMPQEQVQDGFHRWWAKIEDEVLRDEDKVEFAGDSPHFDRNWLRVHLGSGVWDERVSHHHQDISAMGRALTLWGETFEQTKTTVLHRAEEDNEDAIRRAREIKDAVEHAFERYPY